MTPERIDVRGVLFDNVTMDEATDFLRAKAAEGVRGGAVYTPNAEIVQKSLSDPALREILNGALLSVPDGIGVVKAARILGTPLKEKVAGVELGQRVLTFAAEDGLPVYLLGGKPGVAEEAAARVREQHPGLRVCGTHDGYFEKSGEANAAVVDAVNASGAAIVYVCFGAPAQERWIARNWDAMPDVRLFLGLGGSLDIYAGTARRAPRIFIRLGLEWLYRLLREPKRIGRMMQLPRFYFGTWRVRIFGK